MNPLKHPLVGSCSVMSTMMLILLGLLTAVPPASSTVWYVNDTSTAEDIFTTAVGDDANPGTPGAPFLTIPKAMSVALAQDTIKVDAGVYTENVVISADGISLVGVDSQSTVINLPDATRLNGIAASNLSGLQISNLAVNGVHAVGISFSGVVLSRISGVGVKNNVGTGIDVQNSDSNVLIGNTIESNGSSGIDLVSSNQNLLSGNVVVANHTGINVVRSTNNSLISNTCLDNGSVGIAIQGKSNDNIISNNVVKGSGDDGMTLDQSSGNLATNNISSDNRGAGISVRDASGSIIAENISANNGVFHTEGGYTIDSSESNVIRNNLSSGNYIGFVVYNSKNNLLYQNTSESSVVTEFNLVSLSLSISPGSVNLNNYQKNNILPSSPSGKGMAILSENMMDSIDVGRNWWGTTDSGAVQQLILLNTDFYIDMVGGDIKNVKYIPFRLGTIDTTANADSIAPSAPDSVTVDVSVPGQITVQWNAVNANEEGVAWSNDLGGYNIYRDTESNPALRTFLATVSASTTSFVDTTVSLGVTYFYKVTSFDTHSPRNESFYEADTISMPSGGNTPAGNNQTVTFPAEGVTIVFANVSAAGMTTLTRLDTGPSVPGFHVPDCNPFYYVISTTATFTTAKVTFSYSDTCFANNQEERTLELLHFDGVDPDPDTVTGAGEPKFNLNTITSIPLSTFSPFVVAIPVLNAQVRIEPVTIESKSAERGSGVVSVFVEGVDNAAVSDILADSVRLLGAAPVHFEFAGGGKKGPRLLVQMRRRDLDMSNVPVNTIHPVTVSGSLGDGRRFEGDAVMFVRAR